MTAYNADLFHFVYLLLFLVNFLLNQRCSQLKLLKFYAKSVSLLIVGIYIAHLGELKMDNLSVYIGLKQDENNLLSVYIEHLVFLFFISLLIQLFLFTKQSSQEPQKFYFLLNNKSPFFIECLFYLLVYLNYLDVFLLINIFFLISLKAIRIFQQRPGKVEQNTRNVWRFFLLFSFFGKFLIRMFSEQIYS